MTDDGERGKAVDCAPEDVRLFREMVALLARGREDALSPGAGVAAAGLVFLDRPYGAHTLERNGPERLIINLRQLDCFTLVENAVVLARLVRRGAADFADYAADLQRLRYRRGILSDYASRLHYFSEWLADAEAKGVVRNVTADLGGKPLGKAVFYMTRHRERYPALAEAEVFRQLEEIERWISARPLVYLPREGVRLAEERIRDGDLLAVTTDLAGMDVTHVGIALRRHRRVHLLHASSAAGKVLVSPETLYGYLGKKRGRTGIIVARPE